MDTDGTYAITMWTPSGDRTMTLVVAGDGARMSGTDGQLHDVTDFKRTGRSLGWKVKVPGAFAMKLAFEITIEGDVISGQCKPGMFPASPVRGERI